MHKRFVRNQRVNLFRSSALAGFLLVLVFCVPKVGHAFGPPVSFANLTIVKNAQGGDGVFNFSMTTFDENGIEQPFGDALTVATTNQTGTTTTGLVASEPFCDVLSFEECRARHTYTLTEGMSADFEFVAVNCTSDSADNLITTSPEGVVTLQVVPDTNITCTYTNRHVNANPPTVVISSPENKDYTSLDKVPVSVTVVPGGSAVVSTEIKFDDKAVAAGSVLDLFNLPLGNHTLTVTATDESGNVASQQVSFRIVATLPSMLSDVERAYAMGWITNAYVKYQWVSLIKGGINLEQKIADLSDSDLANLNTLLARWGLPQQTRESLTEQLHQYLAEALLLDLDKQKARGYINDSAYNLLKADADWIKSH